MSDTKKETVAADVDTGKPVAPTVDWDDSNMSTSYANVVNASSTREEVTQFFGTNKKFVGTDVHADDFLSPPLRFDISILDQDFWKDVSSS